MGDFALEELLVWIEAFIDGGDDAFPGFLLFDAAVDTLLDEDFFEGAEVPLFVEFAELEIDMMCSLSTT